MIFNKITDIQRRCEISTMVRLLVEFDDNSKTAFINTCKELQNNPGADDQLIYSWYLAEKENLDRRSGVLNE